MALEIESRRAGPDTAVLELRGRVMAGEACQALQQAVEQAVGEAARKVVLEMSGVPDIDSAGLGMLVFCLKALEDGGGELRLASPSEVVKKRLELTRLDLLLPIE